MKKYYILISIFIFILLTGCENAEENKKNEYIALKNQTFNRKKFDNKELPVKIITTIERVDEESINYKVVITEPKENMNDIKVMVVHNYYNEDMFPTIGVFNEPKTLSTNSKKNIELILKDTIRTTKDISKLNLELKIWINYTNDNGEKKDIYYKTT